MVNHMPPKHAWILIILGAAHSLNHSLFLILPSLLETVSKSLNSSFQTLGIITTMSFLLYGVGSLVGGPLSDILGGFKLARISIAFSGISTFIFILTNNIALFTLGMLLMAFWASFYHPTSNNLISKIFIENTAGAMGIHGAAGSVGQMFTPMIAYFLGKLVDWRFPFVIFGVISILVAVFMGKIKTSTEVKVRRKVSFSTIFKIPFLWLLLIYNVLVGLFFRGIELFFPTFLIHNRGFSGELAAISSSLILFFGVIGQLLGGKIADNYGSTKVVFGSSLGVLASLLFLLLLPLDMIGVILFVSIYGLAYFSHQPAMTSLINDISPLNMTGLAYGVMFFFAFGIGSVSTSISGYLSDRFSLETAFWFMTVLSMIGLVVSILILKKIKKIKKLKV
jgi:MFS family permease